MRCDQCGETYIAKKESLEWTDEYIGPFTVEGAEYFECDRCGDYLFSPKNAERVETARRLALDKILQSFPLSAFVTAAEAARILGISRQALHKHRRIRRGFIFQTQFDNKAVYLKKSIDLFKKGGDGRFKLVEPASEVQDTSKPRMTAVLARYVSPSYRQSGDVVIGVIGETRVGGENNYAR